MDYIYNIGFFFEKVSKDNFDRVALKYPDGKEILYSQLEIISNKIAHYFLSIGLKKGDVIGIFNNKSPIAYSCMLAALKTGIIYTNLDLTSPYQRIKKIIERCEPKLLLYDIEFEMQTEIAALSISAIKLYEGFNEKIDNYSCELPNYTQTITGADAAYIMFTSGSTGFPKGAVITHANIINFIKWGQTTYNITVDDVCTNANPIYFDNSVFDFYVTLFSGAVLVPLTNDVTHDPWLLVKAVANAQCTSWFSVPSLLVYLLTTKALKSDSLPKMKRFIFGGEGFPKLKLKTLYGMYGQQAQLYNVYGPTECTCICSSHLISDNDFEDMNNLATLGYLAPNFDYVLLDTDESGKLGELCLKGPNVCAGYYNDIERTEKSFIQNPYNNKYNEIIYKCGDLVKIDDAGRLHFKGRADNQIKHMGYRIELEEIESMLNTLHYINECAVIYDRINDSFGQIIAYVSTNIEIDKSDVMNDLKQLVPDYMLPRKINILKELPKNKNGKIDKVAIKEIKQ